MAEVKLYGADFTTLNKFVLTINSKNCQDCGFVALFAEIVLRYAFYDEESGILIKADNEDEYFIQNSYKGGKKSLTKGELFPWVGQEKSDQEVSEQKIGGVVGNFRVHISKDFLDDDFQRAEFDRMFPDDNEMDVTVILGSRFDMFENGIINPNPRPYFLLRMLEDAFPEFHLQNSDTEASMDSLWNYLYAQIFKNALLALYRLGFYREYVHFEKNDDRLKGKIDVSRHIRFNGGKDNGKIAYSYRKKTEDNKLNHLIIRAYEYLCKDDDFKDMMSIMLEENPDLKRIIQGLKISAPSGGKKSDSYLLGENNTPITSPYYQPYEEMRIICTKILRKSAASFLLDGGNHYVDGFLLYVPDLFEIYVKNELEKGLEKYTKTNHGRYVLKDQYDVESPNKKHFRPDYVIFENCEDIKDGRPIVVLDAKFKPGYQNTKYNGNNYIDHIDDCMKLVRDVSYLRVVEMETMQSIDKKTTLPGVIIYPNKGEFHLNVDVVGKSEKPTDIVLSEWEKEHRKDWEPAEKDKELRDMYLRCFQGERKDSYDEAFNPYGKKIWYCGIPICAIEESGTYIDWRKRQDIACKEAIEELYDKLFEK